MRAVDEKTHVVLSILSHDMVLGFDCVDIFLRANCQDELTASF